MRLLGEYLDVPPGLPGAVGDVLAERGLEYREEPFTLRAGGESNWYFDGRHALCTPGIVTVVSRLLLLKGDLRGIKADVVAGAGLGGVPLYLGMAASGNNLRWAALNDEFDSRRAVNSTTNQRIIGARVNNKRVLAVDDMLSTGSSLIETIEALREDGATVEHALTVVDRSNGIAKPALAAIGVSVDSLLVFDETEGKILPNQ